MSSASTEYLDFLESYAQTPWDALGLSRNPMPSNEIVKKQYRKLALQWHSDRNQDQPELADYMFKKIARAYRFISDPSNITAIWQNPAIWNAPIPRHAPTMKKPSATPATKPAAAAAAPTPTSSAPPSTPKASQSKPTSIPKSPLSDKLLLVFNDFRKDPSNSKLFAESCRDLAETHAILFLETPSERRKALQQLLKGIPVATSSKAGLPAYKLQQYLAQSIQTLDGLLKKHGVAFSWETLWENHAEQMNQLDGVRWKLLVAYAGYLYNLSPAEASSSKAAPKESTATGSFFKAPAVNQEIQDKLQLVFNELAANLENRALFKEHCNNKKKNAFGEYSRQGYKEILALVRTADPNERQEKFNALMEEIKDFDLSDPVAGRYFEKAADEINHYCVNTIPLLNALLKKHGIDCPWFDCCKQYPGEVNHFQSSGRWFLLVACANYENSQFAQMQPKSPGR